MTDKLAGLVLPDNTPVERARPVMPGKKDDMAAKEKKRRWPLPTKPAAERAGKSNRRDNSDWIIVMAGIALALTCALFPWYIFFNQKEFGIRPIKFDSARPGDPPPEGVSLPQLAGARIPQAGVPIIGLDPLPTGTVGDAAAHGGVPLSEQPFPGEKAEFQLIHVANSRAMIRDETGFWVVQRGSWLPNGNRVASIEQRDGRWVLVTSRDAVVPLVR